MCGIFGFLNHKSLDKKSVQTIIKHSQQRGRDSSGFVIHDSNGYKAFRADITIEKLLNKVDLRSKDVFFGHSRLITNGTEDNQPIIRDGIAAVHNGVIVNEEFLWSDLDKKRALKVDSEVIPAFIASRLSKKVDLAQAANDLLEVVEGQVACAALVSAIGQIVLFSNNGSLYVGEQEGGIVFASEKFSLEQIGAFNIHQIREAEVFEVPKFVGKIPVSEWKRRSVDLVPELQFSSIEEKLLENNIPDFRRCNRCILPETMPFIKFDENGVCNFCNNYKKRNQPRPKEELFELVDPYRRSHGDEVIVPFSGGRDSCYALHLIVNELRLKPITYTYDWGMVTDLGRRNISRMSAKLGVENIVVAADISKKRDYIHRNLSAWLESPNLGMLSTLTAGDKHFFKYIETVKKQTGIDLNLWGINPLEVTHFKSGFLGIPPDFEEDKVYSHGLSKQLRYQTLRLKAMTQSPKYFNRSLWDTLSGEYFRSFTKKNDYFHIFDYWRWDEKEINNTLFEKYNWEKASDTTTTWRIGDGTAAFYNYAYYTIAGFTEHDTFRSNQIREGEISRDQALTLVTDENSPRYSNLKWYLDVVGIDFKKAIKTINRVPKLF
jgi:hypothetical protein